MNLLEKKLLEKETNQKIILSEPRYLYDFQKYQDKTSRAWKRVQVGIIMMGATISMFFYNDLDKIFKNELIPLIKTKYETITKQVNNQESNKSYFFN